jgi:asparagine synthase (glutamine-hydrolysing)
MCGIAGIVSPANRALVKQMTDALRHRGPDGEGFFDDGRIAVGHRRLSIIDIDGGQQPISDPSDTIHLICNGEIYNSPGLRATFLAEGYPFRTQTDIEVILPLYLKYGVECVRHLRGMFAFAIWDGRCNRLMLARDHMGQKPLFYCQRGVDFLFASEVKAILASGIVEPTIDLEALWHYASLRYIPDDRSLFKNVHKLQAASTLLLEGGTFTLSRYWNPDFRQKMTATEDEIVDQLESLLLDTVAMHTLSDVRVGAFLSGGIDSSTVAAMMATQMGQSIPSFSIGVKEQDFNEIPYAQMVADKFGMEAHTRVVSADLIHLMPKMVHHLDEPSDPFGVGLYLVSQLAAESVKVVLSGDGGDESFAGYDRYVGQRLVEYYCILPLWARKHLVQKLIGLIPDSFGYKSLAQKARWMNDMSFYQRGARYAHSMSFLRFTDDAKLDLFTRSAREEIDDRDSMAKILHHFEADNVNDLVDRMLYTDLMTRMPDHLLMLGDRMSMAHSLEARPVLVDYKIVEFAAAIPGNLKLKKNNLKYILKRVAERYLPKPLINRKKQGFSFPLGRWMRGELAPFVTQLMNQSRFVEQGIFERHALQSIVDEHLNGKFDHSYRLWMLINLEVWHRILIEGQSVASTQEHIQDLVGPVDAAA